MSITDCSAGERPREKLLERGADALSDAESSQSDQLLTDVLKQALALVDVRVLDHFIVAGAGCLSFAEKGLL